MKYVSTVVCAVAALAAAPAFAGENPAWTYGQLGYTELSSGNDSSHYFGLGGSLGISDLFHVQASYINGTIGITDDPDEDFDGYQIVAGVHPHIAPSTDAVFNLRYSSINLDNIDNDVDAWGLGAGLRHMLTDKFELDGMINWDKASVDNVDNGDSTITSWTVGGRYLFTPELSVGVTYTDANSYYVLSGGSVTADVRYQFGDVL